MWWYWAMGVRCRGLEVLKRSKLIFNRHRCTSCTKYPARSPEMYSNPKGKNFSQGFEKMLTMSKAPQWILNRPNPHVPETFRKFLCLFPFIFTCLQSITFAIVEAFYPVLGRRIPQMAKNHLRQCEVPEKFHSLLTPSVRHALRMIFRAYHRPVHARLQANNLRA